MLLEKLKLELKEKKRELVIEAALERVRGVAMAMKKPEDMLDVCRVISKELERLGIKDIRNIQTAIVNEEKATYLNYEYFRLINKTFVTNIAYKGHPDTNRFVRKMLRDPNGFFTKSFKGRQEVREWTKYQTQSGHIVDPASRKANSLNYYFYSIGPGALGISTYVPLNKEEIILFKRFRNVFQLSFQRFMDIQKAEAQAREAQVEAALERVRGKALAMRSSEELHGVVTTLKKELMGLNIPNVIAATLYLEQDNGSIRVIDLTTGGLEDSSSHLKLDKIFRLEDTDPKLWVRRMFKSKDKYFVIEADEEDFKRVLVWLRSVDPAEAQLAKKIIRENKIKKAWLPTVRLEKGRLNIDLLQPPTPEIEQIMLKLGAGFDLAYRRFLDLQKAEAQARESQVEASLERMRARAMSMHKTDELLNAAEHVHQELSKLGINSMNVSYAFIDKEERYGSYYSINPVDGRILQAPFVFPHSETKVMRSILSAWKNKQPFNVIELNEKTTINHQTYIGEHIKQQLAKKSIPFSVEDFLNVSPKKAVLYTFNFSKGYLFHIGGERLTKEQEEIFLRVTRVFEQTYTRFLDLQKAEAQAREARIEAALEKVRSRSLAMHTADELGEVITVIVEKLKELDFSVKDGVALITYVEGSKDMLQWMENPGFRSATKFYLPYFDHPILHHHWKTKDQGREFAAKKWTVEENRTFLEHIFEHSDYKHTPQPVKDYSLAANSYSNYIAFQKNTSIFINDYSENPLSEHEIDILIRFSRVFEQAYIRFMDLQKAEAQAEQARLDLIEIQKAKRKAEDALIELKATQAQLIQSEKMASLGEMTAGIAHEIQNPLNFVNNFSEVSNELISEMKEQLEKGDSEGALELVRDVKQNLEKINLHGKRADSIVKSMLQHSRSSAGQKEPTDINALVDEYLRLAFHGFRAKDPSFNAKFETDLDNTIEKINLVPQEIGRVMLNLFNNAFYAVAEKRKGNIPGYEPLVIVTTLNNNGKIKVRVKDNGNGMPQHVVEKIFQPFFTTKPTGQGTGLGLSLSYDIITKGHGGELSVNTKQGEGSEFIIRFP